MNSKDELCIFNQLRGVYLLQMQYYTLTEVTQNVIMFIFNLTVSVLYLVTFTVLLKDKDKPSFNFKF